MNHHFINFLSTTAWHLTTPGLLCDLITPGLRVTCDLCCTLTLVSCHLSAVLLTVMLQWELRPWVANALFFLCIRASRQIFSHFYEHLPKCIFSKSLLPVYILKLSILETMTAHQLSLVILWQGPLISVIVTHPIISSPDTRTMPNDQVTGWHVKTIAKCPKSQTSVIASKSMEVFPVLNKPKETGTSLTNHKTSFNFSIIADVLVSRCPP